MKTSGAEAHFALVALVVRVEVDGGCRVSERPRTLLEALDGFDPRAVEVVLGDSMLALREVLEVRGLFQPIARFA